MNSSGDNRKSNVAENGLLGRLNISTFHTLSMPEGFQMYDQDEADINNAATVTSRSQRRHLFTYTSNIVGSIYIGDQRKSPVKMLADTRSVDTTSFTGNYDHDFPPLGSIQRARTINDNKEHNIPPVASVCRLQPNRVSASIASPYRGRCIGENCQLCKRDLSFTPSGPISQPLNPPPVAVLPCLHVYHDECLRSITSRDEESNPTCIACALYAGWDSNL